MVNCQNTEARITNLENKIFFEPDGLASRIAQLEVHQQSDNSKWEKIEVENANYKIVQLIELIGKIPGGIKTIAIAFILLNIAVIAVTNVVIHYFGINESIQMVKKTLK